MGYSQFGSFFGLLFIGLVVYVAINSSITKAKYYNAVFWSSVVIHHLGSFLYQNEKLGIPSLGYYLAIFGAIQLFLVYSMFFLKRDRSNLEYIKLLWVFLVMVQWLIVDTERFYRLKGLAKLQFYNIIDFKATDRMLDLSLILILIFISISIFRNNRKFTAVI